MRPLAPFLALLALLPAALADSGSETDFEGTWQLGDEVLVVRSSGPQNWVGHPTESRRAVLGTTFHFADIGEKGIQFWIMLEGKAATTQYDRQTLKPEDPDRLTLVLSDKEGVKSQVELRRFLKPVPRTVGEVRIGFESKKRTRVPPNQDVDLRLVRAFEQAVAVARQADSGLKRINVAGTIDFQTGATKRHSRWVRAALAVDRVNGADAELWREEVKAKVEAIEAGVEPVVDVRRDFARHLTSLVMALLITEGVDEVSCPAVLHEHTLPYLRWWLGKYGADLPGNLTKKQWEERFEEMLEKTRPLRKPLKDYLHVSVTPEKSEFLSRKRKFLERKYDRKK